MTQPVDQKCNNCQFWEQISDDHIPDGNKIGNCLRFPPSVLTNSIKFPVLHSYRWCGEWQPLGGLQQLTDTLRLESGKLQQAVEANRPKSVLRKGNMMAVQSIDDLTAAVNGTAGVIDSAVTLINGISARIKAAVDAALAGGASAADLAPIMGLTTELNQKAQGLAAAVAANTPA